MIYRILSVVSNKVFNGYIGLINYLRSPRLGRTTYLPVRHAGPKKIMLPSKIKITNLDKAGKTLKRRNEPNPITVTLSKYEVEVNK